MAAPDATSPVRPDPAARVLESGLMALIFLAPMPFGAVIPEGRLGLELGALVLLLIWCGRSFFRATPLPHRLACIALVGLLGAATLQALPLGASIVSTVSPRSVEIREASRTPEESAPAEQALLDRSLEGLDPAPSLSLDPGATASALRTGAALAALLLVATTVAAVCGARRLAAAMLFSAAFQGLYGLLVVASGHDRIWHLPKKHFLDCATGTFVNRNHFGCFMAMTLACGMGLIYHNIKSARRPGVSRNRLVSLFSAENTPNLLLGVLLTIGLAGLLLSFSRASIALGLLALALTIHTAGRFQVVRMRLVAGLLLFCAAAVPLMQIGSERLVSRFASTMETTGSRGTVWADSLGLILDFPAVGSGFGTFAAAYPLVRSPDIRFFFSNAHNDPLQVVIEGGIVGTFFMVLLLIPIVGRMVRSLAGEKGTLAVGFAAGLTAIMLHSLVSFNFHIPSNAAIAAILAGTLQGLPWKHPS